MEKNNIIIDFNNKESFDTYIEYKKQYVSLIMVVLNSNNFEEYIIPCINLIYQFIENELKAFILEFYSNEDWNTISMKISTHNIKKLSEDEFFCKKEFKEIEFFKDLYLKVCKSINYFYNLLGNNTFFKSRYPVEKVKNKKSFNKIIVNKLEFKKNFLNFITCMDYINLVYSSYLLFKSFLLRNRFENKKIEEYIKESFDKLNNDNKLDKEKSELIKKIINEFAKNIKK